MLLLQLSLSNPLPQPVRRSNLAGRRARHADDDDEDEGDQHLMHIIDNPEPAAAAEQATKQPEHDHQAVLACDTEQATALHGQDAGMLEACLEQQQQPGTAQPMSKDTGAMTNEEQSGKDQEVEVTSGEKRKCDVLCDDMGEQPTQPSPIQGQVLAQQHASMGPPNNRFRTVSDQHGSAHDLARPRKMQRTLSLSRTKSTPNLGVLMASGVNGQVLTVNRPAQSC